jgi:hypothetical protein
MIDRYAIVPIPDGAPPAEAIAIGGLDEIMQFLPQTVAYQELEQRALSLVDQLSRREQTFTDGVQVLTESVGKFMDACGRLVDGGEEREAEQIRLDEEEKARAEAARVAAIAEELAPIVGPEGEQTLAAPDDGELEIKNKVDPARFGPNEREDAEPVKPALSYPTVPTSYGNTPESYVKRKDTDPLPFDPDAPGAVDIPPPGPEPGSRLYEGPPQVAQPTSVSWHEA